MSEVDFQKFCLQHEKGAGTPYHCVPSQKELVTFCVSRRRRKMYCGHARLCVCVSVCGCTPTLLHGPGCNLGGVVEAAPSCALLGEFAISARVALLWQHNANPSLRGVCARC